ncbi:MAG: glycosyltransferase family 1 protein [Chloroherpetonaceae bacterium]
MKRLLVNLSYYNPNESGLEVYAKNLLPYLKALNPILLTAINFKDFECYPVSESLSSGYQWKGHVRRLQWTQLELPRIYKRLGASLLFSPVIEAPIVPSVRSVITIHDSIPLRFGKPLKFSPSYHKFILPLVAKRAIHIFCNSHSTAQDTVKFYGVSDAKITVTHLGFDHEHFRPMPKENSTKYFLYLGRPDVNKNLFRLIDAFCMIAGEEAVELWLVGKKDSVYYPPLQEYADSKPQASRIRFLDYVPYQELPKIISGAIALVFPSLWEGFGLPVVEAMACGTPVITSNLSSLPESAGEAALLVNPYQTEEIAQAMKRVLQDPALALSLSQKGLIQAQKFRWQFSGEATCNKLKELL